MASVAITLLFCIFGIAFAIPIARWIYNMLRLRLYPRVSVDRSPRRQ